MCLSVFQHADTGMDFPRVYGQNTSQLEFVKEPDQLHLVQEQRSNAKKGTTCEICFSRFPSASKLKRHYLTHTDERKFKCPVCPAAFKLNHDLKRHMNRFKHMA